VATVQELRVRVWQDTIDTQVAVLGDGPPLVFLHGPWGLRGDYVFLERLAAHHRVYAPWHPGTSPGAPEAIYQLDNWWDLIVYYGELLDCLELPRAPLVGHSFGGMVACELAAALPERVPKLVLLAPLGLWRDELPVRNWMLLPEAAQRAALFAEATSAAAQRFFRLPDAPAARAEAQADFIWAQACTGKFVWPIPDKGLKKHIHRLRMPTLIVWGQEDRLIPVAYGREFADRIREARLEQIPGAGHLLHLEQPEAVVQLVDRFLAE
jgi:pimeloyl-ACP methyl ester carboxylesterase